MAVVERFKQESMYGLSAKKIGRCREVAVSGGSTVVKEYRGILRSVSSNTKGFISYMSYEVGLNLVPRVFKLSSGHRALTVPITGSVTHEIYLFV